MLRSITSARGTISSMLVKMTGRWAPDDLLVVRKKPAGRNAAARHEPAKTVRQPIGHGAPVVVRLNPAVQRGHHQVAMVFGLGEGRAVRIDQQPANAPQRAFR